jgi:hypothetical protein
MEYAYTLNYQRYHRVGGWLLIFTVIGLSAVMQMVAISINNLVAAQEITRLTGSGDFTQLSEVNPEFAQLLQSFEINPAGIFYNIAMLCVAVLGLLPITQVLCKSHNFLRTFQIMIFVGFAIEIIHEVFVQLPVTIAAIEAFSLAQNIIVILCFDIIRLSFSSAIIFFLPTCYFCKSVRVRTYMGSDEYMRKALFAFKDKPRHVAMR